MIPAARRSVKQGVGRLTASADPSRTSTRLTQVSHKAPTRLLPISKTSIHESGAAVCALSNYGAGMLQGDSSHLQVHVQPGARLGITTQGASRIYPRSNNLQHCEINFEGTVEKDGLLVLAPDPCASFRSSSLQQKQRFCIDQESSVALIDWFSAGRYQNGERWAFSRLSSSTSLEFLAEDDGYAPSIPFLHDAVKLDAAQVNAASLDIDNELGAHADIFGLQSFNAFASLILYGQDVATVVEQAMAIQSVLTETKTRIRGRRDPTPAVAQPRISQLLKELAGTVHMGISRIKTNNSASQDAHVVRVVGQTNEDLYRIFHHCLLPLQSQFGMEFYKERIQARRSQINAAMPHEEKILSPSYETVSNVHTITTSLPHPPPSQMDSSKFWSAYMMADSMLPTGGFAHSAGLEAASQLGAVTDKDDSLKVFIQAAVRSAIQSQVPFLIQAHRWAQENPPAPEIVIQRLKILDDKVQASLAGNAPASAASRDQGKSLARIAHEWLSRRRNHGEGSALPQALLQGQTSGAHLAPMFGLVGHALGLSDTETGRLFAYCVARDVVSASVRLALIGPIASLTLLSNAQESAEISLRCVVNEMEDEQLDPLEVAAMTAPVLETLQPCHEILQTRLFRS